MAAAGAGIVIARKLGILALAGKFLCGFFKPILVTIVAAFAAFRSRITGLFRRKTDDLAGRN